MCEKVNTPDVANGGATAARQEPPREAEEWWTARKWRILATLRWENGHPYYAVTVKTFFDVDNAPPLAKQYVAMIIAGDDDVTLEGLGLNDRFFYADAERHGELCIILRGRMKTENEEKLRSYLTAEARLLLTTGEIWVVQKKLTETTTAVRECDKYEVREVE